MKLKNKNNPRVRCEVSYNAFRQILKDDIEQAFKNFRKDMISKDFEDNNKLEYAFYLNLIENFNKYNEVNLEIIKI